MQLRTIAKAVGGFGLAYFGLKLLRPWLNTLGVTEAEKVMRVPGEELLDQPKINATHAITINASPKEIWPWLIQMGQGRAGFYSYAWLENLVGCRMRNADRIIPELQDLKVGDEIYLHPKAPPLKVTVLDREKTLALEGWIFHLVPQGPGRTRLIARSYQIRPTGTSPVLDLVVKSLLFDVAHLIMERKQLREIKNLAERSARSRLMRSSGVGDPILH